MGALAELKQLARLRRAVASVAVNRVRIAAEELATLTRFLLIDMRMPREQLERFESLAVMRNYVPPEILVLAANDCFLYDEDGNVYLDFQGAYSANNSGNCNPRVTGANHFASALTSVLSRARRNRQLPLAAFELQCALGTNYKLLPMNSGCEAIEGATLLAKLVFNRHPRFEEKYRLARQYPDKKPTVVFCKNNFHGRSSWAKAASSNPAYRDPFWPNTLESEIRMVEFGNLKELKWTFENFNCSAFVAEPIQCEGGMNLPPRGYFRGVRELCDRHDVILVLDEVQTGLGRTGEMLGQLHYFGGTIGADIISLAKSLSGGQEVASAVLARPDYADCIRPSEHGSTFGGTPKACATIRAAVRELQDRDLCGEAERNGQLLLKALKMMCADLPHVLDVRGVGLAIGIEIDGHGADEICDRLRTCSFMYNGREIRGCWTNSTHGITDETTVIRLSPPLTVPPNLLLASLRPLALALGHPNPEEFDFAEVRRFNPEESLVGLLDEVVYYQKRWERFKTDFGWVRVL